MANIKSNAKRTLTNKKRELRNKMHKSKFKTEFKKMQKALLEKKDDAKIYFSNAQKLIDSGVAKNVWHKNTGNRKKAFLAKTFNQK